jgi:hypothetical protein
MVQSFNKDNISAFGGLVCAAAVYQVVGAGLAFLVREIFWVPMDYQWGIIVVSAEPRGGRGGR